VDLHVQCNIVETTTLLTNLWWCTATFAYSGDGYCQQGD